VFALLALMLSCKNTKDFDCLDYFNTKRQINKKTAELICIFIRYKTAFVGGGYPTY